MLSYRHAFHAGNHADVLKHVVTIQLLRYLGQKDTPYMYIDTHAGAGVYALDTGYAAKNLEYETGIARLWERKDLPAEYIRIVVRNGLKAMPAFVPSDLTDTQLQALTEYLTR